MGESRLEPRLARFGVFEFRLDTGELRKSGVGVRVQRRSFCVLQALLESHGEVVTREELRARLWPEGTFVDFESGLNTAVNRLRVALGDSAEAPLYIETIARLGYRFVAPVIFSATTCTPLLTVDSPTQVEPTSLRRWWVLAVAVTAAAATIAFLAGTAFSGRRPFLYKQLTFSAGFVENARFLADGRHVVYSLVSQGNTRRAFMTSTDESAVHPQPLQAAKDKSEVTAASSGARIIGNGGWFTVEYPVGRPLYRTQAWIETARVAPRGERVAFVEHPVAGADGGRVMVASAAEGVRCLSAGWESIKGLAWRPSGDEVWFTAATSGIDRKLWAVNLQGRVRPVAEMPGGMILWDINRTGDVLMARPNARIALLRGNSQDGVAQDVSLFDWSMAVAISADGSVILFDESGEGGGRKHSVYVYNADCHKAERIGDGRGLDLSADGKWALLQNTDEADTLWLVSTNEHKASAVKAAGARYNWARFLGGRGSLEIAASVSDPGQGERLIEQELPSGKPITLMTGLALTDAIIDPAARTLAGRDDSGLVLVDLGRKTSKSLARAKEAWPLAFSKDARLITRRWAGRSIVLESVDLQNGTVQPYGQIPTHETAGLSELITMQLAQNGQTFVYSQLESESTLYLVSGWR